MDIERLKERGRVPRLIREKKREIPKKGYHMSKTIIEREYEYCICDYDKAEIVLAVFERQKKKTIEWDKHTGGISKLYGTEYALCNKCLKPALKEIEEYESKSRLERSIKYANNKPR